MAKLMLHNRFLASSELVGSLVSADKGAETDENAEGLNMGAIEQAVISAIERVSEVLKLFPTDQQRMDAFWNDVKLNPINDINRHLTFQTGPQFVPGVAAGVNYTKPLSKWSTGQLSRGINKMADYITQDIEPKIAARQGDSQNTRVLSRYLAASNKVIDNLVGELTRRGESVTQPGGGGFDVIDHGGGSTGGGRVTWPVPGGGGGSTPPAQDKAANWLLPVLGIAVLSQL